MLNAADDSELIARTFLQVSPVSRRQSSSLAGGLRTVGHGQTYRPGAEQFQDPVNYIDSIQENSRADGICRIIPPPDEWKVCIGTIHHWSLWYAEFKKPRFFVK